MRRFGIERVLVLAPHTDDAELGCGGSIAKLLEDGIDVHVAAFSSVEESRPPGTPPDILKVEFLRSMELMRIPEEAVHLFEHPVRRLSYYRQDVLEQMVELRAKVLPEAVLAPASSDVHQDHQVVHNEALRAFKGLTLWGYELPWNQINFSASGFIRLEERHVEAKWRALQVYESQLSLERPYFERGFIEGLARVRGTQVNAPFAEAFEVTRVCL